MNIFDLLTQNDQRTNRDSLLTPQSTGSFRDIAGEILGSRKKKQKKANKYIAGALFLGLGDILTQRRMEKRYNEFLANDTVNRSKIKQEFDEYSKFMAKHAGYTSGGQRSWEEGLKDDIVNKYKNLSQEKINEIYQTEASNYDKLFNRYTTGKFAGSLKTQKTYEELLAPYEKIASNAKRELNPANAGMLKNVFGNVLGIKDDADTVIQNANEETEKYFNAFNSAIASTEKQFGGIKIEEYLSAPEQIQRKKGIIQNRIIEKQSNNQALTENDLIDALSIGYNPTGFKHLDNLIVSDIPNLVGALQKKKALESRGVENAASYLSLKEQDILGRVIPQTDEEIDVFEEMEDENNIQRVAQSMDMQIKKFKASGDTELISIATKLEQLGGELKFDKSEGTYKVTKQNAAFIDNVIKGKVALQNLDPVAYKDESRAFKDSFNLQLEGLTTLKTEPTGALRFISSGKRETLVEYVDPKVTTLPIVPETAEDFANYLNEYEYFQRIVGEEYLTNDTATPDREGKNLIIPDEEGGFSVSFTVVKDEDDKLVWVPSS